MRAEEERHVGTIIPLVDPIGKDSPFHLQGGRESDCIKEKGNVRYQEVESKPRENHIQKIRYLPPTQKSVKVKVKVMFGLRLLFTSSDISECESESDVWFETSFQLLRCQ